MGGPSIPIIADLPTAHPGLGFAEYASALADGIRGGTPPQFTIGIYGSWGSGKSSLLRAIDRQLSKTPKNVVPVFFDAWRYEREADIVVPLLHAVATQVGTRLGPQVGEQLRRALVAVVRGLRVNLGAVQIDGRALLDHDTDQDLTPLEVRFARPIEELCRIPDVLGERRIAVLIDDLDRCSPEKVVSLLEAINLVTDIPGFIYVLALDYDVLVRAIVHHYPHVSSNPRLGHQFVEKMVQVPFRVPPLDLEHEDVLLALVPTLSEIKGLPRGFIEVAREIAAVGLGANPRRIKRFVNSFLLSSHITSERDLGVDSRLLAALLGLQLAWPDEHSSLVERVGIGEDTPFTEWLESDEPGLKRFCQRFFSPEPSLALLRTTVSLSQAVAAAPEAVDPLLTPTAPASEERERNRELLMEALASRKFDLVAGSRELYKRTRPRNIRIRVSKHAMRVEQRTQDGWAPLHDATLLLSRESDIIGGIELIDEHLPGR